MEKLLYPIGRTLLFLGVLGIPSGLVMAWAGHALIRPAGVPTLIAAGIAVVVGIVACCFSDHKATGVEIAIAGLALAALGAMFGYWGTQHLFQADWVSALAYLAVTLFAELGVLSLILILIRRGRASGF